MHAGRLRDSHFDTRRAMNPDEMPAERTGRHHTDWPTRTLQSCWSDRRNAVAALRPTSIATLSLTEALSQLGKEFERTVPATALTLDLETELPVLSPDISLALYRAVQEALTNIRKHAQASKVLVRLRYEDDALELLVLDNGHGVSKVDAQQQGGGFGLVGLRERIELLGGQVSHGPAEQGGYRVTVRVPGPAVPQTSSLANPVRTE